MSSTVYSSVAPKNYFGQPKTILNDRASEKIDGVKGNDKCNRNTIPHIQLEKSLSAMKHRDNERNMLDHPRICMCPRTRLYLGACIIVKRGVGAQRGTESVLRKITPYHFYWIQKLPCSLYFGCKALSELICVNISRFYTVPINLWEA